MANSLNSNVSLLNLDYEEVIVGALSQFLFLSQYLSMNSTVKLSHLDVILIYDNVYFGNIQTLCNAMFNDLMTQTSVCFLSLASLLHSEYQEVFSTALIVAPELSLMLNDFSYIHSLLASFDITPATVSDLYRQNLSNNSLSIVFYELQVCMYAWTCIFLFLPVLTLRWTLPISAQFLRFYYYIFSFARESQIQFEVVLQTFLFFLLYWVTTLMVFDDSQEELIEFMDLAFFYFFVLLVLYLGYKYSIHYFAFLDASITEGRTIGFVAKQVFKDFLNSLSLLLRVSILLFRINVYDTLDDFFDSYYIFVGDFDEDNYLNELFLSIQGSLLFVAENKSDSSYLLVEENNFLNDWFYIYFIVWGKIFYFYFFILELAARLALAFYICYLIIFEIHNVNCSYVEDNYFLNKRLRS